MTGIVDSYVYCAMYDRHNRVIDHALNDSGYAVRFKGTLQVIHHTIQDVFEGQDKIYPVSFGLVEDTALIDLTDQEQSIMDVLHTSFVFMD